MIIDVVQFNPHDVRLVPFRNQKQITHSYHFIADYVANGDWDPDKIYAIFFDDDRRYGEAIVEWVFNDYSNKKDDIMWSYWTIGMIFVRDEALAIDFKLVMSDYVV
jgi:hypothetical protein